MLAAAPAAAVRVCTYNILNFPGGDGSTRVDDFQLALDEVDADVLVVQEMLSQTGVNQFLNDVLEVIAPGEYVAGPFVNGPDTDNALFYKPAVVDLVSHQEISTALRNISEYVLRPVGYGAPEAEFRTYSLHLKAGTSGTDLSKRLAEATILRNHLNATTDGSNLISGGDYNIRSSSESAYQKLVGSEADNSGRLLDPIDRPGYWNNNSAFADIHTQSTRTTQFGGGATGGMDDRYDQILISYSLYDGEGMDFEGTHVSYGNDGLHFNMAINDGTNYAVGDVIADALHQASDHLPLYADFQVPAKLDAPAALDFGDVIVGVERILPLELSNPAIPPADELDYGFSPPTGFEAPAGVFELEPGDLASHDVSMDASSVGDRIGTLVITSDDYDDPSHAVDLTGRVVDHARPSLDEFAVVVRETLDFGMHEPGGFEEGTVSVWNVGADPLQALLEVYAATIAGGDGRFSFSGGSVPVDVGTTPAHFSIEFECGGAAEDSLYAAILTFSTRDDQDVYGASELDQLEVVLLATVEPNTSAPQDGALALSLGRPAPNPSRDGAALALTLPEAAEVRAHVLDVTGRLVAEITSGALPSGTHQLSWDGRDLTGRDVASGIYFVRVEVGGWVDSRKLVRLR
jgi:endonuclease/exonuclease/phosphatase family metal-dependent hydrolase